MKNKPLFFVDDSERSININLINIPEYSKEFGDSSGLKLNINKQRFFHKKLSEFANELTEVSTNVEGFLELFIQINEEIVKEDSDFSPSNYIEFIDFVHQNLNFDELLDYIHTKVENTYTIDIEAGHEVEDHSTSNSNVILQFTNAYAKRIIAVAIMARLLFPLACNFISHHECNKQLESLILLEMIDRIIKDFNYDDDGNDIDLATKIQKFVQVNVDNTLYSDKVIWKYLTSQNITSHSLANDISKDLFIKIIPKLEQNRSIVSFFSVCIKNKINFQFTGKFNLSYKPIEKIVTDDENVNPFVKIEQRLIKTTSELDLLLIEQDIKKYLNDNSKLTEEELEYHLRNVVIHTAQTRLLNSFIMQQIGFGVHILSLNKEEYIKFLFIAKDWFESNGYKFLSVILLGSPVENKSNIKINNKPKRNLSKGKNLLEITNSKIYKDIIKKYENIGNKIDDNVLLGFVNDLINTDFTFYIMPDGKQYSCDSTTTKNVVVEILDYIKTF
ncbi:MAG: hypothetical protein [Bacteriophage sp.]|nr:MAG: hypothetical protein [Bacteriophage sp.]